MELPKQYNPKEVEPKWQKFWQEQKIFQFQTKSKKPIYSIDTPPPTISGKMHLGHAFSYSQMDFIARYKRMRGYNLFYPFGTDDNGLPTERLIEKTKKVKGTKMERWEFIKLCLETLKEIRPGFIQDWKNIGMSCDFSLYYTTIDEHCQKLSQLSFIELYHSGREYRKEAPMMICPNCQTAIAQVEMEDKELESQLCYIKVKAETGEELVFATTRPELLPACVGISVHPEDKRYKHLISKKLRLPLVNRDVVLTADEKTDKEYGTGVVYYCTYGGTECIDWLERHPQTPPIHIMGVEGVYNEKAGKYQGMNSNQARAAILEDLEKAQFLVKTEKIKHVVNVHERCGTEIEYVATKQWFIRYLDLKEEWLAAGKKLRWFPEHMRNRYDNWAKGLKWDWCISRQRHFGIPIPIWYCNQCGKIILPEKKELPVDPLVDQPKKKCPCGSNSFTGEKDVLDTWATSSLTPQIATQLIKNPSLQDKLFPMNLRPQAHDIITFWLFNTLVKSNLHYQKNPWQDVVISGWALDPQGKKMSKSKGNVIEPQLMIEKYSADALRFWAAGSKLGEDLPFQEKDLVTGQKFSNKLWNASKFSLINLEDYDGKKPKITAVFDLWLLSKLHQLIKECTVNFEAYEYSRIKAEVENFLWHTYCDYYLEIVKDRLYNAEKRGREARKGAQYVMYTALSDTLKMMAPIMPYICEEIYQLGFKEKDKSIHLSSWPEYKDKLIDEKSEQIGDLGIEIIDLARKFKSEQKVSLKEEIKELVLVSTEKQFKKQISLMEEDLKAVLNAKSILFEGQTTMISEKFKFKIGISL